MSRASKSANGENDASKPVEQIAADSAASESAAPKKVRILLVDDHPMVRRGLAQLISDEPDLCVCGEADSAARALELVRLLKPDLAVIDISMSGPDGIVLLKELRVLGSGVLTLVLSMYDESLYAERVLRAGAKGYVKKEEAPEKVMTAIRRVLAGEIYVSEKIAARLITAAAGSRHPGGDSPLDRLSDRELQVFRLIADGLTVREIADELVLSVKTVETHREHVKGKLSLKSSNELLRYAVQYGLDQS